MLKYARAETLMREGLMEARKLTPGQTAELLGISTRTLRRWSTAFTTSLSEGARRKNRKRSYTGQDVETLRRAAELLNGGLTLKQAAERLPVVSPDKQTSAVMIAPEDQIMLGRVMERTSMLTDTVTDHDERLDRIERRSRQLEEWAAGPWWRRMFGKPPEG